MTTMTTADILELIRCVQARRRVMPTSARLARLEAELMARLREAGEPVPTPRASVPDVGKTAGRIQREVG